MNTNVAKVLKNYAKQAKMSEKQLKLLKHVWQRLNSKERGKFKRKILRSDPFARMLPIITKFS